MEHARTAHVRAHRQWTPLARALASVGDRWTLLIVLALGGERLRLNSLRSRLPGVSSGVLDHHLGQMVALGLLSRERFREMPPRVEVALTEGGAELLPIAAALARWGMRHEWPAPDDDAHVCADAVLRQLPALLEHATGLEDGVLEVAVADGEERVSHYFQIADGGLRRVDTPPATATVRIDGDETAWVAALGPAREYSALRFAGRQSLGKGVLDSLPRG